METLLRLLNPGWVGSLISLSGLIAALILYRASQIGARPVYQRRALRVIGKEAEVFPEDIDILFKGASVPRLAVAHIVFWNSGNASIRASDIVDSDPIRCRVEADSKLLRVRVLKETRSTIRFQVLAHPTAPNEALLSFDYLDPGDGAVVEVLHTAQRRFPEIVGTLRGVPRGVLDWGHLRLAGGRSGPALLRGEGFPFPALVLRRRVLFVLLAVAMATVAAALLAPDSFFRPPQEADHTLVNRVVFTVVGTVYALPPLILLWRGRRRFPGALLVEDLKD